MKNNKKVNLKKYILEIIPKKIGIDLDSMNELEKARYIYIELCKVFSYNNIYNIIDDEEEKQKMFDKDIDINNYFIDSENPNENKLICSEIAKLYVQLLHASGIDNCQTINHSSNTHRHMTVEAYLYFDRNELCFVMDPIADLYNIQTGSFPEYFLPKNGYINSSIVDDACAIIYNTDKTIGYSFNGLYLEEAIRLLFDEIEQIYNSTFSSNFSKDNLKFITSFLQLEGSDFPFKYKEPIINDVKHPEKNKVFIRLIHDKNELLDLFIENLCKIFNVNSQKFNYNDIPIYIIDFLTRLFKDYHLGLTEGNEFLFSLKPFFNNIIDKNAKLNNLTFVSNNTNIIKLYILNDSLYIISDGNFAKKIILKGITQNVNGITISYIDPTISPYMPISLQLTNYHNRLNDADILLDFYENCSRSDSSR